MIAVGFVGWRGLVGRVLLERLAACDNFSTFQPIFFSTSAADTLGPDVGHGRALLLDAYDLSALKALPVIVSCQGGAYTHTVHPALREAGWSGIWIDAASYLRTKSTSCLVLDPINHARIEASFKAGVRDFVGGNCTVSLLLMALSGLLDVDWIEWASVMTYQAVSGAGARAVSSLISSYDQAGGLQGEADLLTHMAQVERQQLQQGHEGTLGGPLGFNVLPWIDEDLHTGVSREEAKLAAEAHRILGRSDLILDGLCVRVGALRCHSQAVTLKLKDPHALADIESQIRSAPWVKWVPNCREDSVSQLTPLAISGSLDIAVGRVRQLAMGPEYISLFTVADQLLWGAAEPLRCMLMRVLASESGAIPASDKTACGVLA